MLEIVLLSLFSIVCLLISISDEIKSVIPNCLNLGLLGIALTYYFTHLNDNWYVPLFLSFGTLLFFFIIFVFTKEGAIGGGDMKMISISLLTISSLEKLYNYILWLSVFTLLGYLIAVFIKKKRYVRCGPYFSLALVSTLFFNQLEILGILYYSLGLLIIILFVKYVLLWKEEVVNEKNLF